MRAGVARKPPTGILDLGDPYGRMVTTFFPLWDRGGAPSELISRFKATLGTGNGWSVDNALNFTAGNGVDFGAIGNCANVYGSVASPNGGCSWLIRFFMISNQKGLVRRNGGSTTTAGYYIGVNSASQIDFNVNGAGGNNLRCHGSTALSTNVWYTLLVTYDGVSTTGTAGVKMYLNASPETITNVSTLSGAQASDSAQTQRLGEAGFNGLGGWNGRIDFCAIFSRRILTQADAQALYANPWRLVYSPSLIAGVSSFVQVDESITLSAASGFVLSPVATAAGAVAMAATAGYTDADADAVAVSFAATAGLTVAAVATAPASISLPATAGVVVTGPLLVAETITLPASAGYAQTPHATEVASISLAATTGYTAVDGASRQITVGPSLPPPQSAAPTVVGGDQSMNLSIGGVNLSAYHQEELASIQSQTIGRWTATVQLFDNTGTVAALFAGANGGVGLSIIIQEYGYKLFAGCIQSVVVQRFLSTTAAMTFQITATDKSGICDRRIVKKTSYLATQDGADVVRDIVANYLDGEGITTANVPLTLGTLDSDTPFNFQTVRSAFDQIATLTATVWWIDTNGDLHFSTLANLPAAPFSLTETSNNWRGVSDQQGIQVSYTLQDYRNKQYAVSNLNVIPPGGSSSSGPQVDETYTFPQPAAVAAGLAFGYVLLNLPISAIVSLKINGVAKNPYNIADPAAPPYGSAATDWYYYIGAQIVFPSFAPSVGDTIEIIYVPQSTNVSTDEGTALVPIDPALGMCGSGLYEAVEQVQDISLRDDLNAIATAVLAKAGGIPTDIAFEVIAHGLQPGQLLSVNIPLSGLTSKQLLITAVSGRSVGATMGHNCTFRWQVTARSNQDPGNWVKYFERIIRRTEQPKPILQIEPTTFIIGSGSSISAGIAITNPAPIKQAGQLYRMTIAASTPPVNQDLVVTFSVNNLPVGSVTLPAGSAANVFIEQLFDPALPIYVYKDDAVNVNVAYANGSGTVVAARNVTATMEHTV